MSLGLLSRWPDQVSTSVSTPVPSRRHPRDAPAVLLAEDDAAAGAEGLAVGRPGPLPEQVDRAIGGEPVGPLGLVVLEQQRAVGAPERPLGELEPAGQALDVRPSTSSESPASLRIFAIDPQPPDRPVRCPGIRLRRLAVGESVVVLAPYMVYNRSSVVTASRASRVR